MSVTTTFAGTTSLEPKINHANLNEYLWLVILGGFVCFAMAWGIGANDVANAFSTSIGARAITIKQAVFIAGIFEFLGALLLGSKVTDTVRKKIVDYEFYEGEEDLLLLGMFSALISGSFWLALASKYSLPVSTTHTIIGSILGFAWVSKGFYSIQWKSVGWVVLFWIVAPVACGVCGVIFFLPTRSFLLRRQDAYKWTLRTWPFFVFVVCFIMSFFLFVKGGGGKAKGPIKKWAKSDGPDFYFVLLLAFGVGVGCAIIAALIFLVPWPCIGNGNNLVTRFVNWQVALKKKKENELELQSPKETEGIKNNNDDMGDETPNNNDNDDMGDEIPNNNDEQTALDIKPTHETVQSKSGDISQIKKKINEDEANRSRLQRYKDKLTYGVKVDIHDGLDGLEHAIHTQSEQFDFKVEKAFSWLQVLTATLDIFAHGSNDVANAVGPFAAMVGLYAEFKDGEGDLSKKVPVPTWILLLGGLGMTIGLATYGYNIMKVLGVRMAAMSSTRGYCIELASALVIIIMSHHGLPASTTHAQVGSTLGVGLCELCYKDNKLTAKNIVNWKLLAQVFLGWILTLIIAAVVAGGVYAFIAFSPCAN